MIENTTKISITYDCKKESFQEVKHELISSVSKATYRASPARVFILITQNTTFFILATSFSLHTVTKHLFFSIIIIFFYHFLVFPIKREREKGEKKLKN
jgi:thiosulfate reductase cytochrome b subunit